MGSRNQKRVMYTNAIMPSVDLLAAISDNILNSKSASWKKMKKGTKFING